MLRRLLTLLAVVVASLAAVALPLAGVSSAAESIASYAVVVTVHADGTFHVQERISYDFGDEQRHGILRTIPVRYHYDDTRDRVVEVTSVRVTSPTGAPAGVDVSEADGTLTLKVGDPDRTVSGREDYVLDYDVRGAMNVFADHDEVYWNAIGPEWAAQIDQVSAEVDLPAAATQLACYVGPDGSALPCASAMSSGTRALFTADPLEPYEGLTVAVAMPKGTIAVPPPILVERFSLVRAFAVTRWTLFGALAVLLAGLGGVGWFAWTRGRDRRWRGEVPGLDPPTATAEDSSSTELRPLFTSPAAAVEFQPPEGMRPGQIGTLLDEKADVLDVTATIVDLAVRGYLHIEELPRSHWFTSRDWRLTRLKDADSDLKSYETKLFNALFSGQSTVLMSTLKKTFAASLAAVETALYADVVKEGWFKRRPDITRRNWRSLGLVCVVLGGGLTYLLARYTHDGLIGVGAVLAGVALVIVSSRMPARTAKGSAALARTLGFRQYIRTAEAEQLRFEERADVFSRYLPYAVVFGETDRWAHAFASLASAPAAQTGALGWYTGPAGWNFTHFGDSMRSFSTSASATMAATAASSGGSGFSGGSSGGGFGGGGGGSW